MLLLKPEVTSFWKCASLTLQRLLANLGLVLTITVSHANWFVLCSSKYHHSKTVSNSPQQFSLSCLCDNILSLFSRDMTLCFHFDVIGFMQLQGSHAGKWRYPDIGGPSLTVQHYNTYISHNRLTMYLCIVSMQFYLATWLTWVSIRSANTACCCKINWNTVLWYTLVHFAW